MNNIITAVFPPGEVSVQMFSKIWQWDYGQILRIQGLSLPSAVEVHFAREGDAESVTRIGTTRDGITDVPIPDSILEQSGTFYAYVYLTGKESGQTEYRITLSAKKRAKPEPFDTPEDAELFREAIAEVNKSAVRAEAAEQGAKEAEQSAWDIAEGIHTDVEEMMEAAKESASNAAKSAAESKASAENASASETAARRSAEEAGEANDQSQTAATNALQSERSASESQKASEEALAGAEAAEGQAELYAQAVEADKNTVEQTKAVVMELGQQVADNKAAVDRTVQEFSGTASQAVTDVNDAGQTQVQRVDQAGTDAVDEIGTAKAQAVQEIATAGDTQAKAVNAAGTEQTQEITALGAEKVKAVTDEGDLQTQRVQAESTKQISLISTEAAEQLSALQAAGGTLESAIERYYALRRTNEIYTVEELDGPDVTQASTVNRLDGLAGLTCEPSTNTYRGKDEIGALDAFRPTLCNWTLDDEGNQRIHAIEGMPGFKRTGKVNVGVMSMGLYHKKERNAEDNGWLYHWSMLPRTEEGYWPLKECVRPDGKVQGWMIHPHCMAVDIGGVPYVAEGGNPVRSKPSFANYAYPRKQGPAYCYETDADAAWVLALTMIKYGTRDLQAYMRGCVSYSAQYSVSAGEENTRRVILPASQANYFVPGSCVSVGDPGEATNLDRSYAYMHNIVDSAVITAIESVDDANSALVLDVETPFTTTTACKVSAMHWRTGSTNRVLGYDGSPVSNTDGKNICKINEIEILCGGYSICGNSVNIMETDAEGVTSCTMYRTDDAGQLTANLDTIIAEWEMAGEIPVTDNAWKYIMNQDADFTRGCFYPTAYGGGDKTHWADAWYTGQNPSAGTKTGRELRRRGNLNNDGIGGPSCVHASNALPYAYWYLLATLSPNAVRGEWQADA